MAKRAKFTVEPAKRAEGWNLVGPQKQVIAHAETKQPLVQRGRQLGNATPNSQLIIKGENGRIQTEHTYGNDPFPPPG